MIQRLLPLLLAACLSSGAQAGEFAVQPLRIELGASRSASLTVTNGAEPKTYEVRVVRWTQKDRNETFSPSEDLLVAPSTFRLAKDGTQVVRVALNRQLDADEHPYRIFIDEVVEAKEIKPDRLKTVLSMGIPVFVAPKAGPVKTGSVKLGATLAKDIVSLRVENTGKANLKFRQWTVSGPAGVLLTVPAAAYLLVGNTATGDYPLRIQSDGPLKLTLLTDRGSFSTDIKR